MRQETRKVWISDRGKEFPTEAECINAELVDDLNAIDTSNDDYDDNGPIFVTIHWEKVLQALLKFQEARK